MRRQVGRTPSKPRGERPGRSLLVTLGMLLLIVFVLVVGVSLTRELRRQLLLERHVRALRAEIAERDRRINDLRRLREYVETDAFVERIAREKLGYRDPRERVVIVPAVRESAAVPDSPAPAPEPWKSWLALYLGSAR